MTILYRSTRGTAPDVDFRGATLGGLAPDGGLYVPKSWPAFSRADLAAMQGQPYTEIAARVLKPFTSPLIADDVLRKLMADAYGAFDDPAIAPLHRLDDRHWMLELFHGPTLAFKDIGLQLLGRVFEHFLASPGGKHMTVIGATSGDTGSAAIAALAGRKNIDVFILHPNKGPSEIQRRQMTCVEATNIHAVAIDGSFDDCQDIVKSLFNDATLRAKYNFAAVNSINWFRILAQIVYYFVAVAALGGRPASFVVPTGNFGNIYAAYAAMKCGLPISKLAVASNRNDILTRFFASGHMQKEPVHATLSPSMDIQISSNFERLLFDLCSEDGARVAALTEQLRAAGEFSVEKIQLATARQIFTATYADDALTLQTIADVHKECGYILDPHSAVGVAVARQLTRELPEPVVMLATAHPAKFSDTIARALGAAPALPPSLAGLLQKPERTTLLPADMKEVEKFMTGKVAV
jgi:threonine synthase